jgi:hypothetical protein
MDFAQELISKLLITVSLIAYFAHPGPWLIATVRMSGPPSEESSWVILEQNVF